MQESKVEVAIIGAGAAGLMAAITAARAGAQVRLLDGNKKIGAKILVSGGTRCNVTNEYVAPARFHGGSPQYIGRILRSFSLDDTLRFFDRIGVPLKLEETGKFFPVSDSAKTFLAALLRTMSEAGATLTTECPVNRVERSPEGHFVIHTPQETIHARALILCTGGLALPRSGSDGRGYHFARHFGHSLVRTTPALTPLIAQDSPHQHLTGIALPVRLKLTVSRENQKTLANYEGSFLFTHVGYSGPVALNISRHVARDRWTHPDAPVTMRLLPQVAEGQEGQWWQDFQKQNSRKTLFNAINEHFPFRVSETIVGQSKIDPQTPVGRLNGQQSKQVRGLLLDQPIPVREVADYVKAETTAGGITLEEMEPATMMSKLVPGLYFAGEICDVDGWLGGYNFQWAWSSGTVAGRAAAKFVKS